MNNPSEFSQERNESVGDLKVSIEPTDSQSGEVILNFNLNRSRRKGRKQSFLFAFLLVVIIFSGIVGLGFLYATGQLTETKVLGINNANLSLDEISEKVKNQGGLITDENPQISKVIDVEKVKAQDPALFSEIKQGDILVLFTTQGFIYRPETDHILVKFDINKIQS